ncbi:MAG: Rne/Rng family ribonuclease [Oscillospiraceae bacterium]|jgi:ribonuclease G|nr:Rne/Rng family ribonuclease [Oscillospiraceae bacterium]
MIPSTLPAERVLLLHKSGGDIRLAIVEDGRLAEYILARESDRRLASSIYLGQVINRAPSLGAVFVDIGADHGALLPLSDQPPPDVEPRARRNAPTSYPAPGEHILVQVIREPDPGKGARVSRAVVLPGRFVALMPSFDTVGVSRKIVDEDTRARLRALGEAHKRDGIGWILRTAAENETDEAILRDVEETTALWRDIQTRAKHAKPPARLYANDDITIRVARDLTDSRLKMCVVDDEGLFSALRSAFERFAPERIDAVRLDTGSPPLFDRYNVKRDIGSLLARRVELNGGAFLLFEPCETLTAVDVNSGRDSRLRTERDSVLNVNRIAAREIARQLRLRDIGGVILIDFIDMRFEEDRETLRECFVECARADRGRVRVEGFTRRGLLELTRKKSDAPLRTLLTKECPTCHGEGRVPISDGGDCGE